MIMVDELRRWPHAKPPFDRGSSHLTVENALNPRALDELHAFAASIGLQRRWFQRKSWPHYDLTPARREAALKAGAVFVPAKEQVKERRASRAAMQLTRLMTGRLATVVTRDTLP